MEKPDIKSPSRMDSLKKFIRKFFGLKPNYKAIALNNARVIETFSACLDKRNATIADLEEMFWGVLVSECSYENKIKALGEYKTIVDYFVKKKWLKSVKGEFIIVRKKI
jgi:hypothetical protein